MTQRALRILLSVVAVVVGALGLLSSASSQDQGTAYSLELTGTIDPASEAWAGKALAEAEDSGAALAIIRLDTPGGLDTSMREIIKDVIAAPMPVVVYVSPDGARAASAGLFVTQAADVAAMAPQTNIGSASPVSLGGEDAGGEVLGRKIENDAAAYVRALASEHGRDGELAELMVTDAENVTATEALDAGLIDVIASSEDELLAELEGFRVEGPKEQTLRTAGLEVERHDMPLQFDLLQAIVNPTVSFLLLAAGILGLVLEILSPGLIVPGALGLVSFLLGLYGTSQLPVRIAGVALLILGVILIIAEAHVAAAGVLGVVGVIALVSSGLLLYDLNGEGVEISAPVVIAAGALIGGFLLFASGKVVAARRRPVITGWEELIGAEAEVRQPLDPIGQVFVEGALWRAEAAAGEGPIPSGVRVRVESVEGLTLTVRPLSEEEGG